MSLSCQIRWNKLIPIFNNISISLIQNKLLFFWFLLNSIWRIILRRQNGTDSYWIGVIITTILVKIFITFIGIFPLTILNNSNRTFTIVLSFLKRICLNQYFLLNFLRLKRDIILNWKIRFIFFVLEFF